MPALPTPHSSELAPPPTTPLKMLGPSFSAKSKRRPHAQDENAAGSRIPVKSPPPPSRPSSVLSTYSVNGVASRPTRLKRLSSIKLPAQKSSIPFPKTAAAAPVVTPLLVDAHGRLNLRPADEVPRPSKKARQVSIAAPKSQTKPSVKATRMPDAVAVPLWKTLLTSGKGVIASTFDRDLLQSSATPYCATMVTPKMFRSGLKVADLAYHAYVAVQFAIDNRPNPQWDLEAILSTAMDHYLVALGAELMDDVAGPHFTFVDPRNHDDAKAMVRQALRLMRLFASKGYRRDRIVISIPATEAGVEAAKKLEGRHFVRTNLLFISGPAHATICAEAGASFVMFSYAAVSHGIAQRNASNPFARVVEALIPSTKRLADEAIESTAAHFKQRGTKSAILLTGVRCLTEPQRLKGFDSVVLDAVQSKQAKVPTPVAPTAARMFSPTEDSPPGKRRAQKTQSCPISNCTVGGFLSAMPGDTRDVTLATLSEGLGEWMSQMAKASLHMLEYLQGEAQLAHVDADALEEIYNEELWEYRRQLMAECGEEEDIGCPPIRCYDVGFRMASSLWDRPEEVWSSGVERSEGVDDWTN